MAVRRIVLHGASGPTEWPVDHPSLQAGWWPVECDGPSLWRWTDGDAALIVPRGTTALRLRLDDAAADPPLAADTGLARGRQKHAASRIAPSW